MNFVDTKFPEVKIIKPNLTRDQRGSFVELWQHHRYTDMGIPDCFVQDNFSISRKGTIRGLHFQAPFPQGKLVTVLSGKVLDVVVDIRVGSPTFKQWMSVELSAEDYLQLWVPPGFAHGFCVLSASAHFYYKCTERWYPEHEHVIQYNDPDIGIRWPVKSPSLSERDDTAPPLSGVLDLPEF